MESIDTTIAREIETFTTEDGYIVDSETGEVVGHKDAIGGEDLAITVERFLERRARANAAAEGLRREMNVLVAGITERFETRIREQERKIEWLDVSFEPLAKQFALEKIAYQGKGKSIKTAWGTLGFRASRESTKIVDNPTAVLFCAEHCPEALDLTIPSDRLSPEIRAELIGDSEASVKVLVSRIPVEKRGGLPVGAFEYRPAGVDQDFYIKHGGDA